MAAEKVSIIVPVYNIVRWLDECVASLVAQTYTDLEILLVDDGSTDGSGEICDRWAEKDARVRAIHKANGGAASARNLGMDEATGSLWCFVDSDDVVDEHFVESLYEALADNDAEMAACGFVYWTKTERTDSPCNSEAKAYRREEYLLRFIKDWTCAPLTNKLFRREVIGDIRMEEGHRIDDEFFTYQVVINCKTVIVIEECLYHYRLRASSVMQVLDSAKEKVMLDRVEYVTTRYRRIAGSVPQIEDAYFLDAMDTMTRYWYHSKNMPVAQKQIRAWARKHFARLLRAHIPLKSKLGYVKGMYLSRPKVCAEKAPIEGQPDNLFE